MSDSEPPAKTMALTKQQARALEKSDYIRYLQEADLSDARRCFELAKFSTRQHDKTELMAGAAAGIAVALLLGGGTLLGAIVMGLSAFVATLVVIFVIQWIRAPSALYKQAQADLGSTRLLLQQEVERSKRGRLVGRIICINAATPANTWQEIFHGDYPSDFIATLNVSVTNDSTVAATVIEFGLSLIWNENIYPCTEIPIPYRCFLKRTTRRPGGGPRRVEWERLKAFPLNTEITNTTHQSGWLRFWVGPIQDLRLNDAKLRLVAFDHRNEPHTIYDGPVTQGNGCGEIVEGLIEDPVPGWE